MIAGHWDDVYRTKAVDAVSWYEGEPTVSLRLIRAAAGGAGELSVVDVGGGASGLADALAASGRCDVTVLDVSEQALELVRRRLSPTAGVSFVVGDVTTWQPEREYDVWHDRAVFHFLVEPGDRDAYTHTAAHAVRPGGAVVIGAFAEDGPTSCSGLPTCRYSADELAACFPGLRLEWQERHEHVTPAGVLQPFTWVVLRRPS